MGDLEKLAGKIGQAISARGKRHAKATKAVKGILIIGGALLVAIAQFMAVPNNVEFGAWPAFGIGGAALVVIGSLFVLFVDEDDNSEILEDSRAAVAAAQEMRNAIDSAVEAFDEYEEEVDTLIALYIATSFMGQAIKSIPDVDTLDEVAIVEALLESAERSLQRALGFETRIHWTICVYRAEKDTETCKMNLRCIAQRRSIKCEPKNARSWPAGVGVAGASYSRGLEIVVPDLTAPELGNLYNLATMAKPEDYERYRSIAAVPIKIAPDPADPWGVVVVTSDQPDHFYPDREPGVQSVEGARALAGMIELALKVGQRGSMA